MSLNPLLTKLSAFADIGEDDARALEWLCTNVTTHKAKSDLIREGDRPESVFLILDGWAMRYKLLPDGSRHIMAFLVPGDLCDVHVFILKAMDHNIGLLSEARVAAIPKEKMLALVDERPRLTQALWWSSLVDDSILREWLVNMGQRDARERIAHLLVEMWWRLRAIGRVDYHAIDLPLTQQDLADTMGLTPIHVNRILQQLRAEGLVELNHRKLRIPDIERLSAMSGFNPNYLHLDRRLRAAEA